MRLITRRSGRGRGRGHATGRVNKAQQPRPAYLVHFGLPWHGESTAIAQPMQCSDSPVVTPLVLACLSVMEPIRLQILLGLVSGPQ